METESVPVDATAVLSEAVEKPTVRKLKRPQPINREIPKRRKKRKNPNNPNAEDEWEYVEDEENPDDEEDDETSDDEDDDDDDDGTTGSGDDDDDDDDGGEEDENELQQSNEPKKQQQPDINLMAKKKVDPNKNKIKEQPQGPEKTERSPWQQMIDYLVHGAKGAMIKNGDLPTKVSLVDNIFAGLGFKGFKRDVLLQEQAKKFWQQKASGEQVDLRLLNTELVDKKIRTEERREQKPRIMNEHQQQFSRRENEVLQRNLTEQVLLQQQTEKVQQQIRQLDEFVKTARQQAEMKENATRVAQNELTNKNPGKKQIEQTVELIKPANEKTNQADGKDTRTVATEQELQKQIKLEQQTAQAQKTQKAQESTDKANVDLAQQMMAQRALEASQLAALTAGMPQMPPRPPREPHGPHNHGPHNHGPHNHGPHHNHGEQKTGLTPEQVKQAADNLVGTGDLQRIASGRAGQGATYTPKDPGSSGTAVTEGNDSNRSVSAPIIGESKQGRQSGALTSFGGGTATRVPENQDESEQNIQPNRGRE